MNFYTISALANMAMGVALGFLVLFANPRSRVNQLFFLFALALGEWSFFYFLWQIASDAKSALFWVHVLMAGAIFIPIFYFHFVVRLLNADGAWRFAVVIGYAAAVIFSLVNWSPFFILSVGMRGGFLFWPAAGPGFLPFLVIWVLYAILPVVLLVVRLRAGEKGENRERVIYILSGTLIGYAGGCTNYFLWFNIQIPPFGNISASFYIMFVAYAILKHRLFNIKVAAAEFMVFALWLFMFVRMLIADTARDQITDASLLVLSIVIGLLLIRSINNEAEQFEQIEKLAVDLQETNDRQETLIHFIGHEVKGALTKDEGAFAELVEGDFGTLPDTAKPFVERALAESRYGVEEVSNILKASNLKRGVVNYTNEPLDIKALAQEAVEHARPLAVQKGLVLSFVAGAGPYQMTGDPDEIRDHVFRNLIENAINYTPSGSVTVSVSHEHSAGGDRVVFSVQDTGVGITEEDQKRLFTEGGHGKDSVKVNPNSTGYGLFISKMTVEAQGGEIRAVSDGAGKGATFIVEFPTMACTCAPKV